MEFDPKNKIIQLCVKAMDLQTKGENEAARRVFLQAWNEAANDFEKYLAAHYIARHEANVADRLKWFQASLQFALKVNDVAVKGAYPSLYLNIAKCYEELGDAHRAKENYVSAESLTGQVADDGPFYHGTKADLKVGDLLTPGNISNYQQALVMNHIYFTALVNGAGLAAALAKGNGPERVYIVEPTGSYENDPNVTDKKFPGNPTRSYRTQSPLKIVGEVTEWVRQTPEDVQRWRERLANLKGDIIN
jgi:tetratricopeptide (TPR) repeat protein